jgi:SWI/SNF-related matrix-associated actin-dependent regulator of chromatin subfamily A-like protein 1
MHNSLPSNVALALKDYQTEAIKQGLANNGCVYIADEMGLGKTLEALCIAYLYKTDWPMLVICPASVVYQWREQILRWFYPCIQKEDIITKWTESMNLSKQNIVICSYDSVCPYSFSTIICDECHYLKNYKTKRFKIIYSKFIYVRRIILLSGTPISKSNLDDIFTQYKLFDKVSTNILSHDNSGKPANMIQRFKKDEICLKPKFRQFLTVNLDKGTRHTLKQQFSLLPFPKWETMCAVKKCETIVREYKTWLETYPETKIILFYKHRNVKDVYVKSFPNSVVIDGQVSSLERKNLLDYFSESSDQRYLLLQHRVGSVGLDLVQFHTVVFLELDWNPTTLLQAEDRIYRLGQTQDSKIFYFICPSKSHIDSRNYIPRLESKIKFIIDRNYLNKEHEIF